MPLAGASPIDYFTIQRHQAAGIKAEARHLNLTFRSVRYFLAVLVYSLRRLAMEVFRLEVDGVDQTGKVLVFLSSTRLVLGDQLFRGWGKLAFKRLLL